MTPLVVINLYFAWNTYIGISELKTHHALFTTPDLIPLVL